MNAQVRRSGGDLDVYTGLLCVAFLVLVVGCVLLALRNIEHSAEGPGSTGGIVKLVQ